MEIRASTPCGSQALSQGILASRSCDLRNRETLFKLYWTERHSLKEVAKLEGVSRSLVHYYMVKFGIQRREWTGFGPKHSPRLIYDLYWKQRKTIREISRLLNLSRSTVRRHLVKQGALRPRKTFEYWRVPFSGNARERAYLFGLRAGDLNAVRRSKNVVTARVSTTHRAMLGLFGRSFGQYGQCISYPRRVFLTGYDWQIKAYLDNSFDFILRKPAAPPQDKREFYWFLAGLSDSDGTWALWRSNNRTNFAFLITSGSGQLLSGIKTILERERYHVSLRVSRTKGSKKTLRGPEVSREIQLTKDTWVLTIARAGEVRRLARELLGLSRHEEKIQRMNLILDEGNDEWMTAAPRLDRLRRHVRADTFETIQRAEIEYKIRHREAASGVVG